MGSGSRGLPGSAARASALVAYLVSAFATLGCGSAWCPMCPPEGGSSGTMSGTAGIGGQGTGGGSGGLVCPTSPLQRGRSCAEPDVVCTERLADGQILGCTCAATAASIGPTWSCEVVSCPEVPVAEGEGCSIYLLGELCEGEVALCECRWDAEAWESHWTC